MSLYRLYRYWAYKGVRFVARLGCVALLGWRGLGRNLVPKTDGGLVCSNHQSYLDPVAIGMAFDRHLNFVARKTLFRFALSSWFIELLNSIPIDRDGFGLEGIKETIRRVRSGELVLIFPEGTRSHDGQMAPLKSGFCTVARRSRAALIPVGVDGAFDVWPRTAMFPRLAPVHVVIGEPISAAEVARLTDDELVAEIEHRMRWCHAQARAGKLAASGRGSGPRPANVNSAP